MPKKVEVSTPGGPMHDTGFTNPERACPNCAATVDDMHFRIDETVWCLACDWEGHEDDTITQPSYRKGVPQ